VFTTIDERPPLYKEPDEDRKFVADLLTLRPILNPEFKLPTYVVSRDCLRLMLNIWTHRHCFTAIGSSSFWCSTSGVRWSEIFCKGVAAS